MKPRLSHPLALITLLLLAFYSEARQTLPDNDDTAVLQRVTHVSVDKKLPFWDFSTAEATGSPVEVRFVLHGDSCISAMLPGIRRDFILRGDTILRSAVETRFIIMEDTIPMPYASLNPSTSLSARYIGWLFIKQLQFGYTVREWIHSHPTGAGPSSSDKNLKKTIIRDYDIRYNSIKYRIYHTPSKDYIPY